MASAPGRRSRTVGPFKHEDDKPPACLLRIKKDIADLAIDPPEGLYAVPEEGDIKSIYALIVGPRGTPYEHGLLIFHLLCPKEYPMAPPKVRFITTGGRAFLHPYLYTNGTVSLSILGTYAGPQWSSAQTLSSLLLSIQSLLTELPYYDHPFKRHTNKQEERKEADDYNTFVRYEVLKESVCGSVERCLQDDCMYPPALQRKLFKLFLENYANYERCVSQDINLSGTPIKNPFSGGLGMYDHEALASRLRILKKNVDTRCSPTI
ncbi:ubiquitin-conjugating enzyme E2 Z [Rhipicephalus sanguineus]|uniref:Ubiquitin-conjugating enzyme E2 Z n=1 Tax=Rhipicephalus sanguineus TaxID=34632 RepID=A0A9D4T7K1_RHISA|nr:ubiquitin-conjugating enzyme E2 Z [Rhipicephalus sanguineus]KAH7976363.1 hypothetical protein HPB52_012763 [Rhipicephalus sanguineus]